MLEIDDFPRGEVNPPNKTITKQITHFQIKCPLFRGKVTANSGRKSYS